MSTTWHARPETLARYASAPEAVDEVTAASVEQHLLACAECRAVVAGASEADAIARSWEAVADVIDQPRPMPAERALRRLGVPDDMARLVSATTALQLTWLGTVGALIAAAVLAARDNGSDAPFLVLAPLVPLAAVALTFRPSADPAGEAGAPAPLHGAGLAMRRVIAVLVPTLVVVGAAGLALPDAAGGGAAWVLPGLALAIGALAASTFVRASTAAAIFTAGWFTLLFWLVVRPDHRVEVVDVAVFAARGQLVALALVLVASATLYLRRDRFDTLEVPW